MLQITISNNIKIQGASDKLKADIKDALTMANPEYAKRKARRQPVWGIAPVIKNYIEGFSDLIVPRGFEDELRKLISPNELTVARWNYEHIYDRHFSTQFGWNEAVKLRNYQEYAIANIMKHQNSIIQAPAGSGKTVTGLKYISDLKQPALWLTHTKDLLYQTKAAAENLLPAVGTVGIIGDNTQDYGDAKLIIATVQTLQARPQLIEQLNAFIGCVVVDECHHTPSNAFLEVISRLKAAYMLGLTATPDRKDGLERLMFLGIGPLRYTIERDNLYGAGQLIKPEVKFVYTDFSYDPASVMNANNTVDAGGEDINYQELMKALCDDEIRAIGVATAILSNAYNNYSIVLSESVRYAFKIKELVEKICQEANIKTPRMAVVHGGLQKFTWQKIAKPSIYYECRYNKRLKRYEAKIQQYTDEEFSRWQVTSQQRKDIIEQAKNRQIDILFATQLAREGLDLPHLNRGHMITPKRGDNGNRKDGAALEQEIGRIMRPDPQNPNKEAIWFDYADCNVGVFNAQYLSRRKVYTRLQLKVPRKPKTAVDKFLEF